jgi:chromosome partitioning protein
MKGGVGKTTISGNLFRVLFEQFRTGTLLLDLDPQFNLTQALFTRASYERLKNTGGTILRALEPASDAGLFEISTSAAAPPRAEKIAHTLWSFSKTSTKPAETLSIVLGDFRLVKYALITESRKLDAVRDRFFRFVDAARRDFKLVVIDCNPSSSFFTLCALRVCTHLLVPVRPDRYSILGLELLTDFIDSIAVIHPKPPISVVLNGVPRTNYDRSIEDELRAHPVFGTDTLASVIHKSDILVAKPDYTGFATDKPTPNKMKLRNNFSAVAAELATRLGIK